MNVSTNKTMKNVQLKNLHKNLRFQFFFKIKRPSASISNVSPPTWELNSYSYLEIYIKIAKILKQVRILQNKIKKVITEISVSVVFKYVILPGTLYLTSRFWQPSVGVKCVIFLYPGSFLVENSGKNQLIANKMTRQREC